MALSYSCPGAPSMWLPTPERDGQTLPAQRPAQRERCLCARGSRGRASGIIAAMTKMLMRITAALAAFIIGVAVAPLTQSSRLMAARRSAGASLRLPDLKAVVAPSAEPDELAEDWEPPPSPPHVARVLEVGEFHGDEVKARTRERWLGLYVTDKGSRLADSVLTVTAVRDEVMDDDKARRKTGRRVSVNQQPAPLLLVKGARALRPGPVQTVFAGSMSLPTPSPISLTLGENSYELDVATKDTQRSSAISRNDAKLVLRKGAGAQQTLYDLGGTGQGIEAYWELLWAGDMDGDGQLDLYVQVGWHYNGAQRKLFLSSQAGKHELAREVGQFETWGC